MVEDMIELKQLKQRTTRDSMNQQTSNNTS